MAKLPEDSVFVLTYFCNPKPRKQRGKEVSPFNKLTQKNSAHYKHFETFTKSFKFQENSNKEGPVSQACGKSCRTSGIYCSGAGTDSAASWIRRKRKLVSMAILLSQADSASCL